MKNITEQQKKLLDNLLRRDPSIRVRWDEGRGVASSLRGDLKGKEETEFIPEELFRKFLDEYGPLLGPPDLSIRTLKRLRQKKDELGWTHLFFQHVIRKDKRRAKIEVYGSKLAAHFNEHGTLIEVQSSLWRDLRLYAQIRITAEKLPQLQSKRLEGVQGFAELRDRFGKEKHFPLTVTPRLVIFPWKGSFPLAWFTYGYGVVDDQWEDKQKGITYGRLFINATTGEQILFAPTVHFSENPDTGSGLAVTPISGPPFTTRALNIVRVGSTSTYRLKDTTHNRDIVTYDAACDINYNSNSEIGTALMNGTMPVSEDSDGDKFWNRLPTDPGENRTSGQQPEVDAHYLARRQYEWYDALAGGRDGWDAGNYSDPPVPQQDISVIAHCRIIPLWGGSCAVTNGYCWYRKDGGVFIFWLAFMDGDNVNYDYTVGSHFIFAHEYQHAITNFSFEDGAGEPGLTNSGWLGAVHEGLSDTFAGLSTEQWLPGQDISLATPPVIYRNIVYPRDTAAYDPNKLDHFDDRNTTVDFYSRGTILAHCAYLMGTGGVHQRAARSPELVPVYSLGRETFGGISFLKAARIWYRALTVYFSTHGNLTGIPANDENTFRTLREGCVDAAEDLYGSGSTEHCNTILAFYAVGLHPTVASYGADVTFLRWGKSWELSRSYVGLSCPDYHSLDLFINNGGISEWNALINVVDPSTGQPTDYENTIYCRVRNVGDQDAQNVEVEFEYIKAGTGTGTWLPVTDKNGNVQKLTVGTLAAGQSNFPDSDQNSPPTSASVKWWIPPLAAGEQVHHFCLRAKVTSSNDVNTHNNTVQTNINYSDYSPPTPSMSAFLVGNPSKEKMMPLELQIETNTLPKGWKAYIREEYKDITLKPGEERIFTVILKTTAGADEQLEPPLDGDLQGQLYGDITGPFTGSLTNIIMKGHIIQGSFAGRLPYLGAIVGKFNGTIDLKTAQIKGKVIGTHPCGKTDKQICTGVEACLRPWRHVNISQWHERELIGGITVQIQVPWKKGPCQLKLPPTDTQVPLQK